MKTNILCHFLTVALVVLVPVAGIAEPGADDGTVTLKRDADSLTQSVPEPLFDDGRGCTSPSNETCAGATVITFSQIAAGYSTSGVLGCTDDCSGRGYYDVFYRHDCSCTGSYTFDMCNSDGDTYLRVFSGSCCGTLAGSNDDGCGGLDPTLTLTLNAGTSYWIECGSYSSSGMGNSSYNFNATTTCVPPGDTCSNAQDLGSLTSPYSATTAGYANDYSVCSMGSSADRVFYIDVPDGYAIEIWQSWNNYYSGTDHLNTYRSFHSAA